MGSINKIKLFLLSGFTLCVMIWAISGVFSANAEALNQIPNATDDYVGSESCKACHEDQFKKFSKTAHGKIENGRWKDNVQGCESCHGGGKAHVEAGGDKTKIVSFSDKNLTPAQKSQTCLTCHSQTSAHATWRGSAHESAGLSCIDCHSAHNSPALTSSDAGLFSNIQSETKMLKARSESETCYQCHSDIRKSEFQRSTHLFKNEDRESRMGCSACHDAHGSTTKKLLKSSSLNDTCYTCHTEKRGPFLWEHAPSRESCANCHKAHGSNHTSLLKARTPMLCQSCHIQGRHQTVAGKPISAFMINKSCTTCHSQVHGSNHPSGINLQR